MKPLVYKFSVLLFTMLFVSVIGFAQRQIIEAEYFIDTDPGQGNGTAVLAVDGNLDNAIESLFRNGINAGSVGLHTFNIRVKDDMNNWGPVFKTVFYTSAPLVVRNAHVTQAEFFWDTDPGQGNGNALLAFDGNFNDAIETISANATSLPLTGLHILNIRVKDNMNNWGPVFKTIVNVTNNLALRDIKITQGEFFFDTDPGQGQGITMLAFDGNFNDAIESINQSWSYLPDTGMHVLNVRVKDAANNWGPVFQTVLRVLPCVSQPTVTITPSTTQLICPGDTVNFTAQSGFISYTWFRGSTIVGTGQNYDADTAGFYRVYAVDANGCGVFSSFTQVGLNLYNANITASGPTTFCQGGSVVLTAASGNTSYSWNTGATSQSITVASSGTFIVTVSNGNCLGTDTVTVTVNPNPPVPVISASPSVAICPGDSVTLTSSPANTYAWSTNEYTSSIMVNTSGTYSVTVTDNNNCQSSASINVTVFPNPISSINSAVNICQGDTAQISVSGGVSYLWAPASGLNSNTIANPLASPSVSTQYTVYVTGIGGCTDSATVDVFVNPVPMVAASANFTNLCEGGNPLNLYASPSGASSYVWSGPAAFSSTNQNPVISSLTTANSGVYTVTAYNSAGCFDSDTISITVVPGINAVIAANSPVCEGETIQLNGLPNGMLSYNWSGPNGFTANTQNATINSAQLTNTGTYTLTVNNGTCNSVATYQVVVKPAPDVSVSQFGAVLNALQDSANYQWVSCTNAFAPVVGATSQTFTAFENGDFAVIVVYNGCADTSLCYNVSGLGIEEENTESVWTIYPNPNRGNFTIQANAGLFFELMDYTGKIINTYHLQNTSTEISENLATGLYFIRETQSGIVQKLIIE